MKRYIRRLIVFWVVLLTTGCEEGGPKKPVPTAPPIAGPAEKR
jgi:hypothetical protein